jgi:hypothetical protein
MEEHHAGEVVVVVELAAEAARPTAGRPSVFVATIVV